MILSQFALDILQDLEGGRLGDINTLMPEDIYQKIHQSRADVIVNEFRLTKKTRPQWLQPYQLTYNTSLQDNPTVYTRFSIPASIVDSRLIQVQSFDSTQSFMTCDVFQLNSILNNKYSKPRQNRMLVVLDGLYLKVFGNLLAGQNSSMPLKVYAVFHDPTLVPFLLSNNTTRSFYPDGDMYPLDEDNATKVRTQVVQILQPNIAMAKNSLDLKNNAATPNTPANQ